MSDLDRAKTLLQEGCSCVLVKGDKILSSKETGIKPMLHFLSQNLDLKGFSAADKIVGRAAAFLFVKAGISNLFAKVLSVGAAKILAENNIPYSFDTKTEQIINRAGTGPCPMEETVKDIDDPEKAYETLLEKVSHLQN